jgi:hypothetical protein
VHRLFDNIVSSANYLPARLAGHDVVRSHSPWRFLIPYGARWRPRHLDKKLISAAATTVGPHSP